MWSYTFSLWLIYISNTHCEFPCNMVYFLHDRSWISTWIKSISIGSITIFRMPAITNVRYRNALYELVWRLRQHVYSVHAKRCWCIKVAFLIIIDGHTVSGKKWTHVLLPWWHAYIPTPVWVFCVCSSINFDKRRNEIHNQSTPNIVNVTLFSICIFIGLALLVYISHWKVFIAIYDRSVWSTPNSLEARETISCRDMNDG